ncbi:MPV17L2, partial [Symbiodinium necroappetens]
SILGFVGDVVCQLAVERRRSPKEIADLDITKPSRSGEEFDARRLASLTFFSG